MARLESVARAGFYPTPFRVANAIARHLGPVPIRGRQVLRLLDPCAGAGEAADVLAHALGAESFGIELNEVRADSARGRLDHLLHTSAFSVRLSHGGFSCLFLNPPYDYDDESRRLEHAFLTRFTRALCNGGVLVFVVPQARLAVSARYLSSHYRDLRVFRFPDPDYDSFRQIVVFATRKSRSQSDPAVQARLEAWSRDRLEPLPDTVAEHTVMVPTLPTGDILFASLFFDPMQACAEAQRSGAWVRPDIVEQLWPTEERPVRPLMPLRRGHLALLIAAGMLNNLLLTQGNRSVLVKGRTYKESVAIDSDDEDVEIQREVIRTAIAVLDLTNGELELVGQDVCPSGEHSGQAA